MNEAIIKAMEKAGINRSIYPFASFVCGAGWMAHKTADKARRGAKRRAKSLMSRIKARGNHPEISIYSTETGEMVREF